MPGVPSWQEGPAHRGMPLMDTEPQVQGLTLHCQTTDKEFFEIPLSRPKNAGHWRRRTNSSRSGAVLDSMKEGCWG